LGLFSREGRTGSQVFVVDVLGRNNFWTSTDNICVKRDFNRIEGTELDPNELETRLGQFESNAISALREIGARRKGVDSKEWLYVLNLMGLISARNPVTRRQMTKVFERVTFGMLKDTISSREAWESVIAEIKAAGAIDPTLPTDYERHREFISGGKFTMSFPQNFLIFQELQGVMQVIELLAQRTWSLLEAPIDSGGFVTTDRPVCIFPTDGTMPTAPTKLDDLRNTIVFPISPRLLAFGCSKGHIYVPDIDRRMVARLNMKLLQFSTGRVFGPHEGFEFGSHKPQLPYIAGKDVLQIVGEFVWFEDEDQAASERADDNSTGDFCRDG
jgi:Protein of unknown function (DUF4238)